MSLKNTKSIKQDKRGVKLQGESIFLFSKCVHSSLHFVSPFSFQCCAGHVTSFVPHAPRPLAPSLSHSRVAQSASARETERGRPDAAGALALSAQVVPSTTRCLRGGARDDTRDEGKEKESESAGAQYTWWCHTRPTAKMLSKQEDFPRLNQQRVKMDRLLERRKKRRQRVGGGIA